MPAAVAEPGGAAAVEAGAAGTSGAATAGAVGGAAGAETLMPPAQAEPGGAPAVESGAPGTSGASTSSAATGSDVLGTIKTLAPAVGAAANLMAAGAAVAQADAAKAMSGKPNETPAKPQVPVDPDVAALRKKNSLLFGADTPASTDITGGKADVGSLGRATLLGGSSKLGG